MPYQIHSLRCSSSNDLTKHEEWKENLKNRFLFHKKLHYLIQRENDHICGFQKRRNCVKEEVTKWPNSINFSSLAYSSFQLCSPHDRHVYIVLHIKMWSLVTSTITDGIGRMSAKQISQLLHRVA